MKRGPVYMFVEVIRPVYSHGRLEQTVKTRKRLVSNETQESTKRNKKKNPDRTENIPETTDRHFDFRRINYLVTTENNVKQNMK